MTTLENIIDEVWAIMETHPHLHSWAIERDGMEFEFEDEPDTIEQAINEHTDANCHYEISEDKYIFLIKW